MNIIQLYLVSLMDGDPVNDISIYSNAKYSSQYILNLVFNLRFVLCLQMYHIVRVKRSLSKELYAVVIVYFINTEILNHILERWVKYII